ncbi:uncharacterized protein LOC143174890 isoform X2 [Nomia melanderi]|uniref:uncharacterized protein LOC143174890 isoform X2 n=1 Tax=Nomia melanderi TaxID=2448451 RepID=UPI003FCD53DD
MSLKSTSGENEEEIRLWDGRDDNIGKKNSNVLDENTKGALQYKMNRNTSKHMRFTGKSNEWKYSEENITGNIFSRCVTSLWTLIRTDQT